MVRTGGMQDRVDAAWQVRIGLARELLTVSHETRRVYGRGSGGLVLMAVLLVRVAGGVGTATDIARRARMPRTSVLAHLNLLAGRGFVAIGRGPRGLLYQPTPEGAASAALVLDRHHGRVKIIVSKTDTK